MSLLSAQQELTARMQRPQRHRLLQGFPPLPLMQAAIPSRSAVPPMHDHRLPFNLVRQADGAIVDAHALWLGTKKPEPGDLVEPFIDIDKSRPLIVGIIPHTQCIPHTPACGFCTFPHDAPDKRQRAAVVRSVAGNIEGVVQGHGDKLAGRRVDAIYFGGGTANLSSTAEIQRLFGVLAANFKIAQAEVTLEGIPSLFASWFHAHLKTLAALPVRHKRISMGIQTFDPGQIERMGRQSFGDEKTVKGIVRHAHRLGLTASGDFLFALPGQTLEQMCDDVDRAIASGLDQLPVPSGALCRIRHALVERCRPCRRNEGTGVMVEYWLNLRKRLLERGFVQTTLTNFERTDIHKTDRRFIYEEASFNPDVYDALGFGPLSVSDAD